MTPDKMILGEHLWNIIVIQRDVNMCRLQHCMTIHPLAVEKTAGAARGKSHWASASEGQWMSTTFMANQQVVVEICRSVIKRVTTQN